MPTIDSIRSLLSVRPTVEDALSQFLGLTPDETIVQAQTREHAEGLLLDCLSDMVTMVAARSTPCAARASLVSHILAAAAPLAKTPGQVEVATGALGAFLSTIDVHDAFLLSIAERNALEVDPADEAAVEDAQDLLKSARDATSIVIDLDGHSVLVDMRGRQWRTSLLMPYGPVVLSATPTGYGGSDGWGGGSPDPEPEPSPDTSPTVLEEA